MISELLRTNRITAFVIVVLQFFLFIVMGIGVGHEPSMGTSGLIDSAMYLAINKQPWLGSVLAILLIALSALAVQSLVSRANTRTTLSLEPMFWFIGLSMPYVLSNHPLPILFAQLFLILAVRRLMALEADKRAFFIAFDCGMLICIAALFNIFYGLGVVLILMAISAVRTMQWRDVIWSIIGLLLPVYFISAGRYLMGYTYVSPMNYFSIPGDVIVMHNMALLLFILLSLVLLVFSIWANISARGSHNIRKRNVNLIVFSLLILSIVIAGLNSANGYNGMTLCILALPISLITTDLFDDVKRARITNGLTMVWIITGLASLVWLVVNN